MDKFLYPIVPDVVQLTSLSRATVFAEIARGRLHAVKCGRRTLIPHESLVDFVALLKSEAEEQAAQRR
jgi:predicted DNA-binding transcriptional regulator AlpA